MGTDARPAVVVFRDRLGRQYRKRPGRPPTVDDPYQRITLRLLKPEYLELCEVARENRLGLAAVMRLAINSYVADYTERRVFARRTPAYLPE